MESIGSFFTTHLTQGVRNPHSPAYEIDLTLKAYCAYLKSVTNTRIGSQEITSNKVRRAIHKSLEHVEVLRSEIAYSELKIILRIREIKSLAPISIDQGKRERRIAKNIIHLNERIQSAFNQISILPNQLSNTVAANDAAEHKLIRFNETIKRFIDFAKKDTPPPYEYDLRTILNTGHFRNASDGDLPPSYDDDSPPSYVASHREVTRL